LQTGIDQVVAQFAAVSLNGGIGHAKSVDSRSLARQHRGERGFTLIDLMVSVAIVGVLAAVAVPNYRRFTARARQVQAKLMLSGIYVAEQAFYAEKSSYTGCLRMIGYSPAPGNIYYAHGFSEIDDIDDDKCGNDNVSSCKVTDWDNAAAEHCEPPTHPYSGEVRFDANIQANPSIPAPYLEAWTSAAGITKVAGHLERDRFIAIAVGSISSGPDYDIWHMTSLREIIHSRDGSN
jgi:prepilin-type N-terminal cleavage/methylation domain-containing protein